MKSSIKILFFSFCLTLFLAGCYNGDSYITYYNNDDKSPVFTNVKNLEITDFEIISQEMEDLNIIVAGWYNNNKKTRQ